VPPHPCAEFEYANEKKKRKAAIKVKNEEMGEVMGPQMHQGGWTNKKGGGSRHSPPSQFPRITPLSVKGEGEGEGGG
jgi:hypothetical protein